MRADEFQQIFPLGDKYPPQRRPDFTLHCRTGILSGMGQSCAGTKAGRCCQHSARSEALARSRPRQLVFPPGC